MALNRETLKEALKSDAGGVFAAFLLLAAFLAGLILWQFHASPPLAETLLAALVSNSLGGRAAAIGICLYRGLSWKATLGYNMLLETVNLCLFYSLFVLSMTRIFHFQWFERMRLNLECAARKHSARIARWGWFGLFIFCLLPLPVTGPVVGCIIGYLLRMGVLRNFSAVISGCLVSVLLWTKFFTFMDQYLHLFQYVMAVILLVVLVSCAKLIRNFYRDFIARDQRECAPEGPDSAEPSDPEK